MKLGKMLMRIGGAKKADREMHQVLEEQEGREVITISRDVLAGWARMLTGLIMLVEEFEVE